MSDDAEPVELIVGNWFGVRTGRPGEVCFDANNEMTLRVLNTEALNLAAYLAVTADPVGILFDQALASARAARGEM